MNNLDKSRLKCKFLAAFSFKTVKGEPNEVKLFGYQFGYLNTSDIWVTECSQNGLQLSPLRTNINLRNHGFLLTETGWALSPAYDINPNEYGQGLSLNISLDDNSLDLNMALEVAGYFRLDNKKANQITEHIKSTVSSWRALAVKYKIPKAGQDRMSVAFSAVE